MAEFPDDIDNDTICGVCYAEFLDVVDLKLHIKQYHLSKTNEDRFCKFCSNIFSDIGAYASHITNVHLRQLRMCKYCSRLYSDEENLLKHESKHKSAVNFPKLSCSQCETIFNSKEDLENHEYDNHKDSDDGVFLQKCFSNLSSLINMNIIKFFEASEHNFLYICCVCELSTPNLSTYLNHLNTKGCKSFACNECYNVYGKKSELREHCKLHSMNHSKCLTKSHKQCLKCGKFYLNIEIKKHLKVCNIIKCRKCSLTFTSISELAQHITEHSQKTPVPLTTCKYCRKPIIGMAALRKHVERSHKHNIHLYKYNCIYCDIIFKHPKFLFGHFYTKHKDIQPYTCKICNLTFRIRKKFTLHIKLAHQSAGYVEFDENFHVYFNEKIPERNKRKTNFNNDLTDNIETAEGESSKDGKEQNESLKAFTESENENIEVINREDNEVADESCENELEFIDTSKTIQDNDEIEAESVQLNLADLQSKELFEEFSETFTSQDTNFIKVADMLTVKKRKYTKSQKRPPIKKSTLNADSSSSEDSDVPLANIISKKKRRTSPVIQRNSRNNRAPKAFMCLKCNRNCYTYQNYYRHLSLHKKNQQKTCVKCFKNFQTREDLNNHMKSEHATSKLTETLKKIMDQRKRTQQECSSLVSERFSKTMTKVLLSPSPSQATITKVDDGLSVKKFIENFSPDANENKTNNIPNLSIKPVSCVPTEQMIKLIQFTPDQPLTDAPKLRMPTKFTDECTEEYNVSIKVVHSDTAPPSQHTRSEISITDLDLNSFDDQCKLDIIPEVAQEIMLEESEVKNVRYLKKTIVLKDLLHQNNVRIGHLAPQAPFYKIVKIDDILQENKVDMSNKTQGVVLPNGTKLVNVNPLAHLYNNNLKNNKPITKLQDFSKAIVKAMTVLDKPIRKSKKNLSVTT